MKDLLIITGLTLVIGTMSTCKTQTQSGGKASTATADNSRTSVDWNGTYQGTTPCRDGDPADCKGIATILRLDKDQSYSLKQLYVGKGSEYVETKGKFDWNQAGSQITLQGAAGTPYLVGENQLIQLDKSGNRITGNQADQYVLTKIPNGLTETYWKLTELMSKAVGPINGKEPHMTLKADNGRVAGNGGCNNIMGGYTLQPGSRIRFTQMASTMMACQDMQTEDAFLKALNSADSYYLNGDTLVLNRARMAPLARFVAVKR